MPYTVGESVMVHYNEAGVSAETIKGLPEVHKTVLSKFDIAVRRSIENKCTTCAKSFLTESPLIVFKCADKKDPSIHYDFKFCSRKCFD